MQVTVKPAGEHRAPPPPRERHPLEVVLELIRRARSAESVAALQFIAVNDSHLLAPYRQSALWMEAEGIAALSGLTDIEENAPYVQWLNRLCRELGPGSPRLLSAETAPAGLSDEWAEWLPEHALWVPFRTDGRAGGGLLVSRDLPWREFDLRLFHEWMQSWFCAHRALNQPGWAARCRLAAQRAKTRLKRKAWLWSALALAGLLFPIRLTVLAPGELVPAHPVPIRAPFEGVIARFHVRPNERVRADQPLFSYDDAPLVSRLSVAKEALRTAEAEQRQYTQQALNEAKARGALSAARGAVEEKRIEVAFLRSQLQRSTVTAPMDGIAFVDDTSEWIGRSVSAGQRVLRLAQPDDKEIEAWLPVSDAIVFPEEASARLYLSASPLNPISGRISLVAYEATRRPDGLYAYRVRAKLDKDTAHRVGLKGTVRLSGTRVPLVYWMFRRPWAALRQALGW